MRRITLFALGLAFASHAMSQTDVTKKYIENPAFGARFAAWVNPGSFTYNINPTSFEKKSGQVFMEKWVAKTSTLGTNSGMYQTLHDLPTGTYTLVASAKNISQNLTSKVCTGAFLYAGQEQVEFNKPDDYSVTFTVVNGKADIGVRLKSCNGNWVCIDNFRLYYNGENADSIAAEKERLEKEKADLEAKIASATPTSLKVTTYDFVPTGNTIALGRSTISGTCKEKGFCWSTNPEPTIFDDKTTETFDNNGLIYVMRGLKPATVYYVRAYAMTATGYLVYGNVKKIATLPAGNMTYGYDNAGDDDQDARINSACAECIWMYNNLSYIPGFYLNVHYVYGAGAGDGTADCSYGGWMRVSQKEAYQQTGTILHETNHGVGVGTTGEWYNNANLRAETSRGLWLGPTATKMVRFFENSTTATMTGDNTHMWPYGINGAHEDSYQPSKQVLYYANILITHAMHQDGLVSTSNVGFASPAYLFEQDDDTKYYIKSNDEETGLLTGYLCADGTKLKWNAAMASEVKADDNYAWHIKYDPKTRLYYFENVATGRMLSCGSSWTLASKTAPTTNEKLHLMPARVNTELGKTSKTAYWVMKPNKYESMALEATATGVTAKKVDLANSATKQQWHFLTGDELEALDEAAISGIAQDLNEWVKHCKEIQAVAHIASNEAIDLATADKAMEDAILQAEAAENSTSLSTLTTQTENLKAALVDFLTNVKVADSEKPFDLTFMLKNPTFDKDASGWSENPTWSYQCCEYFEKNFDFNQSTELILPAGTYEVRANAFQRPGSLGDIFTDFVQGGKNKVNANIYIKNKVQKIANIADCPMSTTLHADAKKVEQLGYIPNNMASAQAWFKKDLYENSLVYTTVSSGKVKVGIKCSANTTGGYWVCFDNFRLYYYGSWTKDELTPVQPIVSEPASIPFYDLSGRRVQPTKKGIYIQGSRKVMVK